MALVVASNVAALNTYNTLKKNDKKMASNLEKVASGIKINSAKDDASGYAIAKKMSVMERSLQQDIQNVQTGNNLAAIAGGAVDDIVQNLRYLKEKAIDAANDTNTDTDREIIQKEVNQRLQHITDVAATTNYNGKVLLNGNYREIIKVLQKSTGSVSVDYDSNKVEMVNGITVSKTNMQGMVDSFWSVGHAGSGGRAPETAYGLAAEKVMPLRDIKIYFKFDSLRHADGSAITNMEDLNGEGFSIQFVSKDVDSPYNWNLTNVVFDSTIDNSQSTYSSSNVVSTNPEISSHKTYTYYIGIKDVSGIDKLDQAVLEGMVAANKALDTKGDTWVMHGFSNNYQNHKGDAILNHDGWGYYFLFNEYSNGSVCLFGRVVGESTTSYIDHSGGSGSSSVSDDIFVTITKTGTPLVIHDGPRASQELHLFFNGMSPKDMGIDGLKVVPREAAEQAIDKIDNAITYSLNEATRIGAYQQRLEVDAANLVVSEENTTNAKSVIMDADMAKEMTDYSKNNVLLQAAQSMLAQANQNSSRVLSLLQ